MAPTIFVLLAFFFVCSRVVVANPVSSIAVVGVVYCDVCLTNTFSKHSYFLQGVEVHIECTFKATSSKTAEEISFSVNRTTDKYGTYKLEVPQVDGVDCVDGSTIASQCQATVIRSSSTACNVPGLETTTDEISVKSKQNNLCIYSLSALSYRPLKKDSTICGKLKQELPRSSFDSSESLLPWQPLPYLPPFPPLTPFPLFPPTPTLFHPPPPAFNLGDPSTWIPHVPLFSPPPPPAFDLRDPSTWIPHVPLFSPPPPSAFDLRDPSTWIPHLPPSPQSQNP